MLGWPELHVSVLKPGKVPRDPWQAVPGCQSATQGDSRLLHRWRASADHLSCSPFCRANFGLDILGSRVCGPLKKVERVMSKGLQLPAEGQASPARHSAGSESIQPRVRETCERQGNHPPRPASRRDRAGGHRLPQQHGRQPAGEGWLRSLAKVKTANPFLEHTKRVRF